MGNETHSPDAGPGSRPDAGVPTDAGPRRAGGVPKGSAAADAGPGGALKEADKKSPKPVKSPTQPCPKAAPPPCHHPINLMCSLMRAGVRYGLVVRVNWESPTGNLGDISNCEISEVVAYSNIPNPPFGPADGRQLPQSGKMIRLPRGSGIPAENGTTPDSHFLRPAAFRKPPSAGSYTVNQKYEYCCRVCMSGWVSLTAYVITYTVYEKNPGQWWLKTEKRGPGGPFVADERIVP